MIRGAADLLGVARQALTTHRARVDVAGTNIANVATPNYARQRAELSATGLITDGLSGVSLSSLRSARSQALDGMIVDARGLLGASSSRMELVELAENAVAPLTGSSLSSQLDAFYSALRRASAEPEHSASRLDVLGSAEELAAVIRGTAQQLDVARQDADRSVVDAVQQGNELLQSVRDLDRSIVILEAAGGSALAEKDERTRLLEELAELLAIEVHGDGSGSIRVVLQSGATLLADGQINELVTRHDATVDRHDIVVRTSTCDIALDAGAGGRTGAALQARDGDLSALIDDLDAFAFDLAAALNGVHSAGFGADGGSGRDLFESGALEGAASRLRLSADLAGDPSRIAFALGPGLAGDNTAILQLIATADQALVIGGRSPSASIGALAAGSGTAMRRAGAEYQAAQGRQVQLEALRESRQGVSLDEELLAQAEAQRAFEAAARLVQVADEMFATVLSLKG